MFRYFFRPHACLLIFAIGMRSDYVQKNQNVWTVRAVCGRSLRRLCACTDGQWIVRGDDSQLSMYCKEAIAMEEMASGKTVARCKMEIRFNII